MHVKKGDRTVPMAGMIQEARVRELMRRMWRVGRQIGDAGPGLEQSRDAAETVTTGNRDSKGNAGNAGVTRANLLWNTTTTRLKKS